MGSIFCPRKNLTQEMKEEVNKVKAESHESSNLKLNTDLHSI